MTAPRVYFYASPESDNLQDDIVILAEGLRALGIPFFASADYWREGPGAGEFLFRKTPEVRPDDCDVVVIPYTWFNWVLLGAPAPVRREVPEGLFKPGRRYRTVYMDTNDGLRTVSWEPGFRQFDVILRTKFLRRAWAPSNLRPWVLGLSNRMLRMTEGAAPFGDRQRALLVNFGASHGFPHGARIRSHERFDGPASRLFEIDATRDDLSAQPTDPYDRLMWEQTNHRHSRSYYERLKRSQAVSCFCGELIPPMPWRDPAQLMAGGNRARLRRAWFELLGRIDPRPERIVQWDSWRFWEALAAGCAVFNLDLERYGALLPVMPENGRHYFGVDLDHPERILEGIAADPAGLERVAAAGRAWALEHYSPPAMARRFLSEVGFPMAAGPN